MLELTNQNYCATIIKIEKTVKLDGLDNLIGAPVFGFTALIPPHYDLNQLYVLFTAESELSEDFCKLNNLYDKPEMNLDQTQKGYISHKRRVRAVKLRGHISSALIMPLSSLSYTGADLSKLKEGDTFNSINGIHVVKKYVIQRQYSTSNGLKKAKGFKFRSLFNSALIPEHVDTTHWGRNEHKVSDDQTIIVSQKLHGCVHANTIVKTLEFGDLRIQEIVEKKTKCKILSRNITLNKDVYVDIDNYYFKENDGEWYEIELEDGTKLIITGNNPVYLPDLKCYRLVENLKVDDDLQLLQ